MGYFAFGPGGQKLFDAYPYGGLSEYHTAPERNLVVLPDSVTFEQGARFGYLGTAFSALRKAGAGPGRTVLVDGISGTLGLGACLIAPRPRRNPHPRHWSQPRPARRRQELSLCALTRSRQRQAALHQSGRGR
jgi:hypothetical protein